VYFYKPIQGTVLSVLRVCRSTFETRAFSIAGPRVWNSLPDLICGIQLLTPNNLGQTWRRICSLDIWSISTLEVFTQSRSTNGHLLTYLLTYSVHKHSRINDWSFCMHGNCLPTVPLEFTAWHVTEVPRLNTALCGWQHRKWLDINSSFTVSTNHGYLRKTQEQ